MQWRGAISCADFESNPTRAPRGWPEAPRRGATVHQHIRTEQTALPALPTGGLARWLRSTGERAIRRDQSGRAMTTSSGCTKPSTSRATSSTISGSGLSGDRSATSRSSLARTASRLLISNSNRADRSISLRSHLEAVPAIDCMIGEVGRQAEAEKQHRRLPWPRTPIMIWLTQHHGYAAQSWWTSALCHALLNPQVKRCAELGAGLTCAARTARPTPWWLRARAPRSCRHNARCRRAPPRCG